MTRRAFCIAVSLLVLASIPAFACLWDTDTLQMERLRFPGVLEIITGKFVRHSPAYYEWRILDRQKKLATQPNDPALIDDLAVAYAKLGRPEEGIPLLEKSLASQPNRYETLSNLGTLLFFAGRLDESKQHIRRALEINPNAHFGREQYQLLLTEYVQQSKRDSLGVMSDEERFFPLQGESNFARYVLNRQRLAPDRFDHERSPKQLAEVRAATKGVLGMMHFADYQSPILLEALGDLLVDGQIEENAAQLAARAYLQAAKHTNHPEATPRFKKMADEALATSLDFEPNGNAGHKPYNLELQLAGEVSAAGELFSRIQSDEKQWIAEGRDLDQAFAAKYYDSLDKTVSAAERQVRSEPRNRRPTQNQQHLRLLISAVAVVVLVPASLLAAGIWWYRSVHGRKLASLPPPARPTP